MQNRRNILKQAGVALTFGIGFVTQAKAETLPSNCFNYGDNPYNYTLDAVTTHPKTGEKECQWKRGDGTVFGNGCG